MSNGNGLLPCPFCGSTDLHQIYEDMGHKWGYIACFGCGAKGGAVKTWYDPGEEWRASATAQWNRRASNTESLPETTAAPSSDPDWGHKHQYNEVYDHNSKIAEKIVAQHTTTPAIYGLQPDHKFKEGASPLDVAADIASALSALSVTASRREAEFSAALDRREAVIRDLKAERDAALAVLREAADYIARDADHYHRGTGPGWALLKRLNDVLEQQKE